MLIQHVWINEHLKYVKYGRILKFERRIFQEDFDQKMEIIPQYEIA